MLQLETVLSLKKERITKSSDTNVRDYHLYISVLIAEVLFVCRNEEFKPLREGLKRLCERVQG